MQSLTPIIQENMIPMKVKKASAKILSEHGYTIQNIVKLTDLGTGTVHRISKKERGDLAEVDVETWNSVEQSINKVLKMNRDRLTAKVFGFVDEQLDTKGKSLPFGSLVFALKTLSEMYQPKGQTNNLNLNSPNLNVQVVRGSVTYSNTTEKIEPK